jgi:hypothetical protein
MLALLLVLECRDGNDGLNAIAEVLVLMIPAGWKAKPTRLLGFRDTFQ